MGEEYSFPADIYSFAIAMYQLVTGKEAFADMEPLRFAHMSAHEGMLP